MTRSAVPDVVQHLHARPQRGHQLVGPFARAVAGEDELGREQIHQLGEGLEVRHVPGMGGLEPTPRGPMQRRGQVRRVARPEALSFEESLHREQPRRGALDLELLDAATDRPLAAGTRTRLQRAGHGWVAAPLAPGGRIRFRFGPGRQFYEVDCRGYEPRTIELDGTEPGHREITLRMQPQE